ncbi:hypothetical protein SteCoe_17659 [Stentor coeruleus]|uniref:Uncharacterized protein n=1 Tax=Stentor coeruleus TaxID=5963 RepID=A0A1R2BYQ5_9CILI|nr:hypothetical protein SteCoe_17659 [Stentor coeruleus]
MKELVQQNHHIGELSRIIISRSEDIAILKSLSDRKTGKLRVQTFYAEKTISESEFKEECRYSKEESLLSGLQGYKIDSIIQKKQLEKISKKILRINLQFEDEPSDSDLNLSEIHVQKVMSVRVNQENTLININDKGQAYVNLPTLTVNPQTWRENYSSIVKALDCCLLGEILNPYLPMFLCVKHSRGLYLNEISRQKHAIVEGLSSLSPNIAVMITNKKSKSTIPQKKSLSPIKKTQPLPEPDYLEPFVKMMLNMNAEVEKNIKTFRGNYYERNAEGIERIGRNKNPVLKALRARNYEKFSAVNPWAKSQNNYMLSTVKTLKSLHMQPEVLFDLQNMYFDENLNLPDRIKVIHSCLIIQNTYKLKRQRELIKKVIIIQKFIRGFLARKKALFVKFAGFRKVYYLQRLKHWYPLMVNKRREHKLKFSGKDYSIFYQKIVMIQKVIKGFLARHNVVYWKKEFRRIKEKRSFEKIYEIKQNLWKVCFEYEQLALRQSGICNYDMNCEIWQTGYEKSRQDIRGKLAELENRKECFRLAKENRVSCLN